MDIFDPYEKLKRILGPAPLHPWGALIPQALLWSFRRFCIQKLIVQEGTLMEYLWEDHLELIHSYAPKGLEMACIDWLTSENIAHVSSSLDSYNTFFIEVMKMIDIVMEDSDYKMQDTISEFLDTGMGEYLYKWLGDKFLPFLIFPMKIEDDNEFTSAQFTRLISTLMDFSRVARAPPAPLEIVVAPLEIVAAPLEVVAAPLEVVAAPLEVVAAPLEVAPPPAPPSPPPPPPLPPPPPSLLTNPFDIFMPTNSLLWQYASLPSMVKDTFQEQKMLQQMQSAIIKVEEPKVEEQVQLPSITVQEAIRRRRLTIKKNGRYSRVKTRRRHLN